MRAASVLLPYALVAVYVLVAVPAQAQIVVNSSGPSAEDYPVGTRFEENSRIYLEEGDTITILDGNGTRVLRGAGTFLARTPPRGASSAFASLTSRRGATRARTGAVRARRPADGDLPRTDSSPPVIWTPDVARSGTFCLAKTDPVRLWRSDTASEESYAVSHDGADLPEIMSFPSGESLAPLPDRETLHLADAFAADPAASVFVHFEHQGSASEIAFRLVEFQSDNAEDLAALLIDNGCMTQLEWLTEALQTDEPEVPVEEQEFPVEEQGEG